MTKIANSHVSYVLRDSKAKKPTPITGVIRFNDERINFGTGFKILPSLWNTHTYRVKDKLEAWNSYIINEYLENTEKAIRTIIATLRAERNLSKTNVKERLTAYLKPQDQNDREKHLFGFIEKFIEETPNRVNIETGKQIHERTIKKYRTTLRVLKEFAATYRRKVDFDTIDLDFYEAFTAYLTAKEKLAVNSVGKYIQTLKVFLNDATARGINTNLDYKNSRFKVLKEDADHIALNEDELMRLCRLDLSAKPRLERVRDLFLVGCYTGLRFSDFTAIRPEYIQDGMIRMEQYKTMGKVVIPCHPIVTALLEKYGGQLPQSISNQKMNDYLKEVCQLAGLTDLQGKGITKAGKRIIRSVEKWQLVSTHTARRSFATNMYKLGIPAITIMRITGHKTEKAFMRYIKLDEEQHAKIIANFWKNLNSITDK